MIKIKYFITTNNYVIYFVIYPKHYTRGIKTITYIILILLYEIGWFDFFKILFIF